MWLIAWLTGRAEHPAGPNLRQKWPIKELTVPTMAIQRREKIALRGEDGPLQSNCISFCNALYLSVKRNNSDLQKPKITNLNSDIKSFTYSTCLC